ncbi:type I-E CRISPR-associated protein Cse2/CasB [Asticcacaulis sp. EMRT-3]|uniref:type I-E CRISPR-associated protein Cse2/CasB n=1 Tax=Asticcacaulis sp. EMRT-3 TaxID=3040349 RepID=UPI0024AFF13E|nr:type I-E CRISPR-associated protein Cse2/CasB [Asticcacaulis sp. EMRT-3]MDI7775765.1 type I-E CRISPR-associated protein Cse2/CasB [Asticcacaulis sp. EMRT-3]
MADPTHIYRTVFHDWWEDSIKAAREGTGDRASAAALRRLDLIEGLSGPEPDVLSALMDPTFRHLRERIARVEKADGYKMTDEKEMALTIAARALAGVRSHQPLHPASVIGGEMPDLSESRFKALMRVETDADLFDQARRISALICKTAADTGMLGASLYLWRRRPAIRRDWARHYYGLDLYGVETPGNAAAAQT